MRVSDVMFPSKCMFCGKVMGDGIRACDDCIRKLPYVTEPVCKRCGKPILRGTDELCTDCKLRDHPGLDSSVALFVYREDTKKAMFDLKYEGCYGDAGFYADELCRHFYGRIRRWHADVLVPIPIHKRRLRFRGYNQAELVATELGLRVGLPTVDLLKRTRYTSPQKNLNAVKRRENLRQAFEVDNEIFRPEVHESIVLVDDIYTTGATLEACAGLLKKAGAKAVYAVCICIGSEA